MILGWPGYCEKIEGVGIGEFLVDERRKGTGFGETLGIPGTLHEAQSLKML